jgi:tRNA(Arg) A34 adenosine deaminase TadA
MDPVEKYLNKAFKEAITGVRTNQGGPFGAVIVKDGTIIGKGCNRVTSEKDPTAHAEIVAIRNACKSLDTFDLSGAMIYSTCEPCPMCLSAIYWAGIQTVYYSATRHDAEEIGFKDNLIYKEINREPSERNIRFQQIANPVMSSLFEEWKQKIDKIPY